MYLERIGNWLVASWQWWTYFSVSSLIQNVQRFWKNFEDTSAAFRCLRLGKCLNTHPSDWPWSDRSPYFWHFQPPRSRLVNCGMSDKLSHKRVTTCQGNPFGHLCLPIACAENESSFRPLQFVREWSESWRSNSTTDKDILPFLKAVFMALFVCNFSFH